MYVKPTMSTWITTEFPEILEALILEISLLNPEDGIGKRFRYRFLHVPMKCSREFCIYQNSTKILQNYGIINGLQPFYDSVRDENHVKVKQGASQYHNSISLICLHP